MKFVILFLRYGIVASLEEIGSYPDITIAHAVTCLCITGDSLFFSDSKKVFKSGIYDFAAQFISSHVS